MTTVTCHLHHIWQRYYDRGMYFYVNMDAKGSVGSPAVVHPTILDTFKNCFRSKTGKCVIQDFLFPGGSISVSVVCLCGAFVILLASQQWEELASHHYLILWVRYPYPYLILWVGSDITNRNEQEMNKKWTRLQQNMNKTRFLIHIIHMMFILKISFISFTFQFLLFSFSHFLYFLTIFFWLSLLYFSCFLSF